MAKLAPLAPEVKPTYITDKKIPVVIDISIRPNNGARVLTIEIPPFRQITDKDRRDAQLKLGKEAAAMCDVTGQLIFDEKNVTTLKNALRPEFDGKTISTKFLRELFDQIEKSKSLDPKAIKPRENANDTTDDEDDAPYRDKTRN